MKQIICRQDGTRSQVVFLLDTFNKENGTMKAWRDKKDSKLESVSFDFYKSTKALNDSDESKLANEFIARFGASDGITVRRRMYSRKTAQELISQHETAKKAEIFDKAKYVAKFINAVQDILIEMESESSVKVEEFIERRIHH